MTEDNMMQLMKQLDALRVEHRRLDNELFAMTRKSPHMEFEIASKKKQRAALKYEIGQIEKIIYPDVPA